MRASTQSPINIYIYLIHFDKWSLSKPHAVVWSMIKSHSYNDISIHFSPFVFSSRTQTRTRTHFITDKYSKENGIALNMWFYAIWSTETPPYYRKLYSFCLEQWCIGRQTIRLLQCQTKQPDDDITTGNNDKFVTISHSQLDDRTLSPVLSHQFL